MGGISEFLWIVRPDINIIISGLYIYIAAHAVIHAYIYS